MSGFADFASKLENSVAFFNTCQVSIPKALTKKCTQVLMAICTTVFLLLMVALVHEIGKLQWYVSFTFESYKFLSSPHADL